MKSFLHKSILGTAGADRDDSERNHSALHFILRHRQLFPQGDTTITGNAQEQPEAPLPDAEVQIILRKNKSGDEHPSFLTYFLAFPPEIQFLVLTFLDFGDIERLRRTCRFFRIRISKPLIRSLFPEWNTPLRNTCYLCLTYDPTGSEVICSDVSDARYPLSSLCIGCFRKGKGFMVGRKYLMGNGVQRYLCRWCGDLVLSSPAQNRPEYHELCFGRYMYVMFAYYIFGLTQFVIMIVAPAICWHYYKPLVAVMVPTILGFVVSIFTCCISIKRSNWVRTYHLSLFLEAGILTTWAITMTAVLQKKLGRRRERASDLAALVFIAFNLVFRLFNVIGYLILVFEFKVWRHKTANMSRVRRVWIRAIEIFIFFAAPQCVVQDYPGVLWLPGRRRRVPPAPERDYELPDIIEQESIETNDLEGGGGGGGGGGIQFVVGPYGDIEQVTTAQQGPGHMS